MSWMVLGVLLCCCTLLSSQLWQWFWKSLARMFLSTSGTLVWVSLRHLVRASSKWATWWWWWAVACVYWAYTWTSVWWWSCPGHSPTWSWLGNLIGLLLSTECWRSIFDHFWLSQRFEKIVLETKFLAERQTGLHALANCNLDVWVLSYACRNCCHLLHNSSNFQNYFW